jgi:hypothetical protein
LSSVWRASDATGSVRADGADVRSAAGDDLFYGRENHQLTVSCYFVKRSEAPNPDNKIPAAHHGGSQLLGSVRARQLGPAPVLLIENFDRMTREVIEEVQSLFLELINADAVIVTLHNGKRYDCGMVLTDIILALVEMEVAHQHSAKLSMRVREAVDARRRAGGIIHNRSSCPRGRSPDASMEDSPKRNHRGLATQQVTAFYPSLTPQVFSPN